MTTKDILIPEAHYDSKNHRYCNPYECSGNRYPALPYLDPNNKSDSNIILKFKDGEFMDWSSMLYIGIILYVIFNLIRLSNSISARIS